MLKINIHQHKTNCGKDSISFVEDNRTPSRQIALQTTYLLPSPPHPPSPPASTALSMLAMSMPATGKVVPRRRTTTTTAAAAATTTGVPLGFCPGSRLEDVRRCKTRGRRGLSWKSAQKKRGFWRNLGGRFSAREGRWRL